MCYMLVEPVVMPLSVVNHDVTSHSGAFFYRLSLETMRTTTAG